MMELLSALLLVSLVDQGLGLLSSVEVFYVKPTEPVIECPSGNSPCHSLQYYANHSSFTNNRKFLFLDGEHHLESVVGIRNVAELSLVGATSGVKILCKSLPSGFHVEKFTGLTIDNMAISNCTGPENITLHLSKGSEVSLSHITISTSSGYDATGLVAIDVLGSFSILGSTFYTPQGGNILVDYSLCNGPSHFNFSNNTLGYESDEGTEFRIYCSNVQIVVADSIFETGLSIDYSVLTKNSVIVKNSIFNGGIRISMCSHICEDRNFHCGNDFLKVTGSTIFNQQFAFRFNNYYNSEPAKNCIIVIEDSLFYSSSGVINFDHHMNDTSVQVVLRNVTFDGNSEGIIIVPVEVAILFINCTFKNNNASVIQAFESIVNFQGRNIFKNNSALIGTGIQLLENSFVYLEPYTSILFEDNHADYVGGAIYTDRNVSDPCFFRVNSTLRNTVVINSIRNTANFAGSFLYGAVGSCCPGSDCKQFSDVFNISNTETDPSAIASDPEKACLCEYGKLQPNCSDFNNAYSTHVFPGQDFPVRLAVVGGRFDGVVPGAVRAYFSNGTLGPFQSSQASDKPFCKNFYYSINSTEKIVAFQIIPERHFYEQIIANESDLALSITVHLKDCPLGFSLSSTTGSCVCDRRINNDNTECDINDQSFLCPANSWLGFVTEPTTAPNKSGVIFHPNCPIGYCLPDAVKITSNTSDSQCEPHRTGLLCGECEEGYSLTLGNQKCMECTNTYLLLVLPFALAGLFLVAALFALNLTVTEGSINGLIFYANVMGMNHTILFSGEASYLFTFLAWLNLDIGVSMCLFDGMDGYAETWLQFVFPVYLWAIILVIILFYNKFPTLANRLGGENAVKVLATLLLLSYTKLQRTVVTILSFTWLEYPDGAIRYVWLYDANVEFFKGKHLYLGIAGILVLVVLILPYTLCLAFFQQLQACSGHRLFQWVNKLKPVFDSYAGPYKDKYRFWTGMLLAVRTLLIILFTINTAGSADLNLLIILVVSSTLLMSNSNGIYKKWPYNYSESFFYLQLVVFAGGILYARHNHGSITAVADTSIGLSLTVFLTLVGYHVLTIFKTCYYRLKGYAEIVEEDHLLTDNRITN